MDRRARRKWTTWPNLLSLLRVGLLPFLVWAACEGNLAAYLWILALSFASDCADGALARWLHQATAFGALLDSWADLGLISVHMFGIWRLFPVFFHEEFLFVMAAYLSYVVPILAGFFKYGKMIAYHTRGDHVISVLLCASGVVYLLGGGVWWFRLAAVFTVATQAEKLAMTWMLPEWQCDVRSIADALKLRIGPGVPCPQEAVAVQLVEKRDDAPC